MCVCKASCDDCVWCYLCAWFGCPYQWLQEIFKECCLQNSYSMQLASLVLEQQQEREREESGPFDASTSQQLRMGVESGPFWLAVERPGHLGTINLVADESDAVSSLVFTPAESLIRQVRVSCVDKWH